MDENNESYDLPDLSELDPLPAEPPQSEAPQQYTRSATDLAPVFDVPVNIKAVLGRA
jgi:flagellar motor switch protein FliN/FliY